MTFSPTISTLKEQRTFKRRLNYSQNNFILNFGDGAIISSQEGLFEARYIRILKKSLKSFFKKTSGYTLLFRKKCWLPIFFNYPLSKKAKNARMGKGKGSLIRWAIKLRVGTKIIETKNISIYRLMCLKKILQKSTSLRLNVIHKIRYNHIPISFKKNFYWVI